MLCGDGRKGGRKGGRNGGERGKGEGKRGRKRDGKRVYLFNLAKVRKTACNADVESIVGYRSRNSGIIYKGDKWYSS